MQKAQTATKLKDLKMPEKFKILESDDFTQFLDSLKETNVNIVSQLNATLEFVDNYLESNNLQYSGAVEKVLDYEFNDLQYVNLIIKIPGYSIKDCMDFQSKLVTSIVGWNRAYLNDIGLRIVGWDEF